MSYCTVRWLSEADAAAGVWQKHRAYVTTAWHFLNDHGYINFGVASSIHANMLAAPASKGSVIVIGAGMAGMGDEHKCVNVASALNLPPGRSAGTITAKMPQS
jgi:hypothetical protein